MKRPVKGRGEGGLWEALGEGPDSAWIWKAFLEEVRPKGSLEGWAGEGRVKASQAGSASQHGS